MNYKDVEKKSGVELKKLLVEKQNALRMFYFENSGSHTRNVKEGRGLRKDIARIKTAQNMQVLRG
jgi:ribosomal protein L29